MADTRGRGRFFLSSVNDVLDTIVNTSLVALVTGDTPTRLASQVSAFDVRVYPYIYAVLTNGGVQREGAGRAQQMRSVQHFTIVCGARAGIAADTSLDDLCSDLQEAVENVFNPDPLAGKSLTLTHSQIVIERCLVPDNGDGTAPRVLLGPDGRGEIAIDGVIIYSRRNI